MSQVILMISYSSLQRLQPGLSRKVVEPSATPFIAIDLAEIVKYALQHM